MEEVQKKLGGSMARGMFQRTHAQYVNWVSYPGEGLIMAQDGFNIGQQVVSNYIMQYFFLLCLTSLPPSSSSYCYYDCYYHYYYYINIIFH